MNNTKWIILTLAALWVALTAAIGNPPSVETNIAAKEGFAAPPFELMTLSGDATNLKDLNGHTVILNFWTSWCPPCKAEMQAMQNIQNRYREQGVIVLAVNVTSQDNLNDVKSFITELDISLSIPLDIDGSIAEAYRVQAFPSTYFIDTDGVIRKIIIGGPLSETVIASTISELID
ncbi:MAG: TlpA family protein disulfide reductase [Anaerolineae bacterium]|nr:TlpA family protein disulfide reductase [Anaerolineae bacterium]